MFNFYYNIHKNNIVFTENNNGLFLNLSILSENHINNIYHLVSHELIHQDMEIIYDESPIINIKEPTIIPHKKEVYETGPDNFTHVFNPLELNIIQCSKLYHI